MLVLSSRLFWAGPIHRQLFFRVNGNLVNASCAGSHTLWTAFFLLLDTLTGSHGGIHDPVRFLCNEIQTLQSTHPSAFTASLLAIPRWLAHRADRKSVV